MSKIKVAVISQSMNIGGGETMAARLASYIDAERFEVKLFILGPEKDNQIAAFLKENGVTYECLGIPTHFTPKGFITLSRRLKAFAPDVVHEHLDFAYAWIWCWLHRRPLVATIHGDPFRMKNNKVVKMIRLKSRQHNLRVIGCSGITATQSRERFSLPEGQVGCIYNPIDLADYTPVPPRAADKPFTFLHVGRFNPVKNHALLIEAFAAVHRQLPDTRLMLAGDGNLFDEIKTLVAEKGLNGAVTFLGNVADIPALLPQGDALVLSSLSEACPMVILEAMATGLPCVATDVGGVPELVTDNGLLVPSGDAAALAQAMCRVATEPALWAQLSAAATNNVPAFDRKTIARCYEAEYTTLVNRK